MAPMKGNVKTNLATKVYAFNAAILCSSAIALYELATILLN